MNDVWVDIEYITKLFDLPAEKIYQLRSKGLPAENKQYPLMTCVGWYIKYLKDAISDSEDGAVKERIRLTRAKTEKTELETAKLRNRLLDADQIRQQIMFLVQSLKDGLLAIPGGICHDLENKDAKDIRQRLEIEIKMQLNKIGERIDNEICQPNDIKSCDSGVENQAL